MHTRNRLEFNMIEMYVFIIVGPNTPSVMLIVFSSHLNEPVISIYSMNRECRLIMKAKNIICQKFHTELYRVSIHIFTI